MTDGDLTQHQGGRSELTWYDMPDLQRPAAVDGVRGASLTPLRLHRRHCSGYGNEGISTEIAMIDPENFFNFTEAPAGGSLRRLGGAGDRLAGQRGLLGWHRLRS